jgi:hypothetical protein
MPPTFKFRSSSSIGDSQAELDEKFLQECYVDNGTLEMALNTRDPHMFISGRTGSGKTALLLRVRESRPDQVIEIEPSNLALTYVSNSTILRFFENTGVRLDPFYKLLWRHVFAVELIKTKFQIKSEEAKKSFRDRVWETFSKDKTKERALRYLDEWGDKFWKPTENRITETTQKFESDLKGALGVAIPGKVEAVLGGKVKVSSEEKAEIVQRGQEVVNNIQIQELNEIFGWLSEKCLTDPQHPYYITIDRLDEDWVEDSIRYKLILALLDTAKDLKRQIQNAKVLVAIRRDLLERVLKLNRKSGIQEEKFQSLCFDMRWSEKQLTQLLDSRIGSLVREQYTSRPVTLADLLPSKINREDPVKYLLNRTFLRPRDAILLVNQCIALCTDRPKITQAVVNSAELEYSKQRFRSVLEEWYKNHAELADAARILYNRETMFKSSTITTTDIERQVLELLTLTSEECRGEIYFIANAVFEGQLSAESYRNKLLAIFYKVGFVGVRKEHNAPLQWCYTNEPQILPEELDPGCSVRIHPAFWRVFRTQVTR